MSLVKRSTSLRPYRSMTQEGMAHRARGEARRPRTGGCPPARTAPRSAPPLAAPRDSMAGGAGPGRAAGAPRDRAGTRRSRLASCFQSRRPGAGRPARLPAYPPPSPRRHPRPMGGRLLGGPANGAARCCGKMAAPSRRVGRRVAAAGRRACSGGGGGERAAMLRASLREVSGAEPPRSGVAAAGRARRVTGPSGPAAVIPSRSPSPGRRGIRRGGARGSPSRGLFPDAAAGTGLYPLHGPKRALSPGRLERGIALSGFGSLEGGTGHSDGALPEVPFPHQKHQVS